MTFRDSATLTIPTPEGKEQISLTADLQQRKLLTATGAPIDRKRFLSLRDRQGAMIFADDPVLIRKLLRLQPDEGGVLKRV
jgi:hypothetical protein